MKIREVCVDALVSEEQLFKYSCIGKVLSDGQCWELFCFVFCIKYPPLCLEPNKKKSFRKDETEVSLERCIAPFPCHHPSDPEESLVPQLPQMFILTCLL